METRDTFGYFAGLQIISFVVGALFLCVCLMFWWFTRHTEFLMFGAAMFFGGLANGLACHVLHQMEAAGYDIGYWRWFPKDFRLYSEYWRIAPLRGWSRLTLAGSILCFLLAAVFLFSIPAISWR